MKDERCYREGLQSSFLSMALRSAVYLNGGTKIYANPRDDRLIVDLYESAAREAAYLNDLCR